MTRTSLLVAAGLISAVAATPVLAQTNAPASTAAGRSATASNWLKQPGSNDFLASHLKGVDVYNDQNQKLGSIDELILDRSGKVQAAILDVGGVMGVGVHRVAVPFDQLRFTDRDPNRSADTRATTLASPNGVNPANIGVGNTTASNGQNTAVNNGNANYNNVPNRAILNMTADQLKAAPEFRYNS